MGTSHSKSKQYQNQKNRLPHQALISKNKTSKGSETKMTSKQTGKTFKIYYPHDEEQVINNANANINKQQTPTKALTSSTNIINTKTQIGQSRDIQYHNQYIKTQVTSPREQPKVKKNIQYYSQKIVRDLQKAGQHNKIEKVQESQEIIIISPNIFQQNSRAKQVGYSMDRNLSRSTTQVIMSIPTIKMTPPKLPVNFSVNQQYGLIIPTTNTTLASTIPIKHQNYQTTKYTAQPDTNYNSLHKINYTNNYHQTNKNQTAKQNESSKYRSKSQYKVFSSYYSPYGNEHGSVY